MKPPSIGDGCPTCEPSGHTGVWNGERFIVCPTCNDRGVVDEVAQRILAKTQLPSTFSENNPQGFYASIDIQMEQLDRVTLSKALVLLMRHAEDNFGEQCFRIHAVEHYVVGRGQVLTIRVSF